MTETPLSPAAPDVAGVMQRLQHGLLQTGYSYLAGDPATWPLCPVIMAKDQGLLLIAPWPSEYEQGVFTQWQQLCISGLDAAGLILIGPLPTDNPAVDALFAQLGGAVAYLNASTRQIRIRQSTPVLSEQEILRLLAIAEADPTVYDLRATLQAQVAERQQEFAFHEAVSSAGARKPYLTYTLIGICVAIFLAMVIAQPTKLMNFDGDFLSSWGALSGTFVRQGQWWRLITHAFLHAGLIHIAFNMFALLSFGGLLEPWQGRWRLLALFLFSAITGGILSLWWYPPTMPMIGASGGLFGLMGAMIAMLIRHKQDFPAAVRERLSGSLKKMLGINLLISLMPGISLAGHLGGLLGGLLLGLIIIRSPIKPSPLSANQVFALIALLVGTVLLGGLVIAQLPAG